MKRIEIFKKTKSIANSYYYLADFPKEENKLICIVFLQICCSQPVWYISSHYNDFYEYERIFYNELDATEIFFKILQEEYISKEFLTSLDFNLNEL